MRHTILNLEESKIRDVANAGLGRNDVLAFWFGESDEVTPDFIRQAAIESLQRGETFYAHNLGLPELREAIATEMTRKHPLHGGAGQSSGSSIAIDRIAVTAGGVNALMLAAQALVNAGDEVVAVTPVWPNLTAQAVIMGARLRTVPLSPIDGAWTLNMASLLTAITPTTKLLIVNAPNNPTGWTLSTEEQRSILAHCRATGTWILADEVYENLYYESRFNGGNSADAEDGDKGPIAGCAPSFLDVSEPHDRLVVVHSFSKSYLMTGWRLGWMVVPPGMTTPMGKLIEFNTSCCSVFVQRAALVAVQRADEVTPRVVHHLKACRDALIPALQHVSGVSVATPKGGMYAFFKLPDSLTGGQDSLTIAKRLVSEAGLGLAPGSAFGPEADGWLRWCFASRDIARLHQGVSRLQHWLAQQAPLVSEK